MSEHRFELRPSLAIAVMSLAIAGCASDSERRASSEYSVLLSRLESAPWSEPYAGPLGVPKGAQRAVLGDKRIICLDIPDEFEFMDPALVRLLEAKAGPFFQRG